MTGFCISSIEPSGSPTTAFARCVTPGTAHVISLFPFIKVSLSFRGFSLNERLSEVHPIIERSDTVFNRNLLRQKNYSYVFLIITHMCTGVHS